jgi:hypothetical protein
MLHNSEVQSVFSSFMCKNADIFKEGRIDGQIEGQSRYRTGSVGIKRAWKLF